MTAQPVLINGKWRASSGADSFQATNPATKEQLSEVYPVSPWSEIEEALTAAATAFKTVRSFSGSRFADFLEAYAAEIELRIDEIV